MIEIHTCPDGKIMLRGFGDFNWVAAEAFRHLVGGAMSPGIHLIIDLGRVESIDATGVSALVGSVRRARSVGGRIQILNIRRRVRATLQLAGVDGLLLPSNATTGDVA